MLAFNVFRSLVVAENLFNSLLGTPSELNGFSVTTTNRKALKANKPRFVVSVGAESVDLSVWSEKKDSMPTLCESHNSLIGLVGLVPRLTKPKSELCFLIG